MAQINFTSQTSGCEQSGGFIRGTFNGAGGTTYTAQLIAPVDDPSEIVPPQDATSGSYDFSGLRNGFYTLQVTGADGSSSDSVGININCGGGGSYPADGTFIRAQCYGFDKYQVLANGTGGERQGALVEANSTECGYVPPVVPGCMDPQATNYNPAANTDDGTCVYPPAKFYPVGGVLPNPIAFAIAATPLLEGELKRNHFVKATIYRHSDDSPIGTLQARVYNGQAVLDVAAYLRPLVKTSMDTPADIVTVQEGAVVRFYIGHKEAYNGIETEETLITQPPMYAVEAATDGLNEDMGAYVLTLPAP